MCKFAGLLDCNAICYAVAMLLHWSEPSASDSFMAGKAVDSTPIILTFGFLDLTAIATPASSAPAYWHVYSVNIWKVFEKLKADRALASDDIGIVKSVNYVLPSDLAICCVASHASS